MSTIHHRLQEPGICGRRAFLRLGVSLAAGAPLAWARVAGYAPASQLPAGTPPGVAPARRPDAKVAVVPCDTYGPALGPAFGRCFDLLGGLKKLVKDKTITVKINLTGTNFSPLFDRPVGESYMTHCATARALALALFKAGARRVRFAESCNSHDPLERVLLQAGWDVNALLALGRVEFENTRNRGRYRDYAQLSVPSGGYLFDAFSLNRAYAATDVLISLAKLKHHSVVGVSLSLMNLIGITPNSLYGDQAFSEDATADRGRLHDPGWMGQLELPGQKQGGSPNEPGFRLSRIVADLGAARPVHLAIVDGITAMSGGEAPWIEGVRFTTPGLLVAGLNTVSTDTVCAALLGGPDAHAARGAAHFPPSGNHLLLAEQKGLGTADLMHVEVLGTPVAEDRHQYGARGS